MFANFLSACTTLSQHVVASILSWDAIWTGDHEQKVLPKKRSALKVLVVISRRMFHLDEVVISDWEDRETTNVIVPVSPRRRLSITK
jgi:hypothetical protein